MLLVFITTYRFDSSGKIIFNEKIKGLIKNLAIKDDITGPVDKGKSY